VQTDALTQVKRAGMPCLSQGKRSRADPDVTARCNAQKILGSLWSNRRSSAELPGCLSSSPRLGIACATVIAGGIPMSTSTLPTERQQNKPSFKERIRRRAHELYIERGGQPGSDLDDWLRAEAEILRAQDAAIDEASEESFPASDAPAY